MFLYIILSVIFLYIFFIYLLWHRQEQLIFAPDPFSRVGQVFRAARSAKEGERKVKEWYFTASDETKIQGFISLPKDYQKISSVVVYFGGIREECSWFLSSAESLSTTAVICMNYRGYGFSEGRASQKKILSDCKGALDLLKEKHPNIFLNVYLVGRSLGSGVAGYLAKYFDVKGVVLVTPYDSVLEVAKRKYWWVPVRYILRNPFDAIVWAKRNTMPLLMLLSEKDETVPHEHSLRLFDSWNGKKELKVLEATDHSNIVDHKDFFLILKGHVEANRGVL